MIVPRVQYNVFLKIWFNRFNIKYRNHLFFDVSNKKNIIVINDPLFMRFEEKNMPKESSVLLMSL